MTLAPALDLTTSLRGDFLKKKFVWATLQPDFWSSDCHYMRGSVTGAPAPLPRLSPPSPEEVCQLVLPVVRSGLTFQEEIVYIACPKPLGKSIFR